MSNSLTVNEGGLFKDAAKSNEAITKARALIKAHLAKGVDMVQHCASMIVLHATLHGDVTQADGLVSDLGKGSRSDSLVKWFVDAGCMEVRTSEVDGKKVQSFGLNKARQKALQAMLEADGVAKFVFDLKRKPWQDAKKQANPYDGFDLSKEMAKLLSRANKINKDADKANNPKTNLKGLNDFASFVAAMNEKQAA